MPYCATLGRSDPPSIWPWPPRAWRHRRYGDPEMIGASPEAIATAEDREKFKEAMTEIGLAVPESGFAYTLAEAMDVGKDIGFPLIIRPSYILGRRRDRNRASERRRPGAHGRQRPGRQPRSRRS